MANSFNWHRQPEVIALFGKAYAICGNNSAADFPYDIEAELELLCDGAWHEGGLGHIGAWDIYLAERS